MTFPFLAGEIPPATKFGEGPDLYTPALTVVSGTNPNLGADGTAAGRFARFGPHMLWFSFEFLFSGAGLSAGSGSYQVSLPTPADTSILSSATHGTVLGAGNINDSSTVANSQPIAVTFFTTTQAILRPHGAVFITDSMPFIWAEGDRISGQGWYPIVEGS